MKGITDLVEKSARCQHWYSRCRQD